MTETEAAEMTGIVAELEARLAAEQKKSKYWQDHAEMMQMRAQSLAHELDLIK
jgi:hypothetical protein